MISTEALLPVQFSYCLVWNSLFCWIPDLLLLLDIPLCLQPRRNLNRTAYLIALKDDGESAHFFTLATLRACLSYQIISNHITCSYCFVRGIISTWYSHFFFMSAGLRTVTPINLPVSHLIGGFYRDSIIVDWLFLIPKLWHPLFSSLCFLGIQVMYSGMLWHSIPLQLMKSLGIQFFCDAMCCSCGNTEWQDVLTNFIHFIICFHMRGEGEV